MISRFTRVLALTFALAFTGLTGLQTSATAEAFDGEQKTAIEQIIRNYLLTNPEILDEVMGELEKRREADADNKKRQLLSEYRNIIEESPLSFVTGNPDGDVTIVEFFDYNCGYCRRALADLQDLIKTDPNLRVVIKEFPILREESLDAAKVSVAALRQDKYMEYHVALLGSPGLIDMDRALAVAEDVGLDMDRVKADIADDSILAPIREAHQLADTFDIQGTPSYIIGDEIVVGAVGFASLKEKVEAARSDGCKTC